MSDINALNELSYAKEQYPNVFSPFTLRGITFPNRIVFPPWGFKYANDDQTTSDKLIKVYEDLAAGGCGCVITGAATVSADTLAPGMERYMRADEDKYIPELKKIFDRIIAHGSLPGLQIAHGGGCLGAPGKGMDYLLTPSGVPDLVVSDNNPHYKVRAMTPEEVQTLINQFTDAAVRGVKAGAGLIDIHGAHGFMLTQFLSPKTNKRTDAYGGSPENRARIITEIIKNVRKAVGDKALVAVRISTKEFIQGGLEPEDYKEILPLWEEAGLDILNASIAHAIHSSDHQMPVKKMGPAPYVELIARLKEYTKLPIITVGSILSLELAEKILTENKAELIAIGRPLMADPQLVKKSAEAREGEVRKCLQDNYCIKSYFTEPEVYCSVNPDYKKTK